MATPPAPPPAPIQYVPLTPEAFQGHLDELVRVATDGETTCWADYDGYDVPVPELSDQIALDLQGVSFDTENLNFTTPEPDAPSSAYGDLVGLGQIGDLPILGVSAGGDWEYPVFFFLYWDGVEVRAHVPTEGNVWNQDTGAALGNDEEADLEFLQRVLGDRLPPEAEAQDVAVQELLLDPEALRAAVRQALVPLTEAPAPGGGVTGASSTLDALLTDLDGQLSALGARARACAAVPEDDTPRLRSLLRETSRQLHALTVRLPAPTA